MSTYADRVLVVKEARAKAKAEIMRAARHLSAARMGWVASAKTPGVNYTGCSKGLIADSLVRAACSKLGGNGQGIIAPTSLPNEKRIDEICAAMRAQENTHGATGDA